jgi:hypothetical protein
MARARYAVRDIVGSTSGVDPASVAEGGVHDVVESSLSPGVAVAGAAGASAAPHVEQLSASSAFTAPQVEQVTMEPPSSARWYGHEHHNGGTVALASPTVIVGTPRHTHPVDTPTSLRFAQAARGLGAAARALGLRAPAFRCPPRTPGINRALRRSGDAVVIAVRIRDRGFDDVVADMVEGVLRANQVPRDAASRIRGQLAGAVTPGLATEPVQDPVRDPAAA